MENEELKQEMPVTEDGNKKEEKTQVIEKEKDSNNQMSMFE